MREYWRPVGIGGPELGAAGLPLAGGPQHFCAVERRRRGQRPEVLGLAALPDEWRERLTAAREDVAGLAMEAGRPRVMGILNVTPDSFSDGGRWADPAAAGRAMLADGADILDVGAESTRPGAADVPVEVELQRLAGVMPGLEGVAWSIDTRKAKVMAAALEAGAVLINDVSALSFDPGALALVAARSCPVVLVHHQGTPERMQDDPRYDDVLLDVFDWLEARIAACVAAGIERGRIVADVGLGFGKTLAHNRALLAGLSLFHGLGVPLLVGASRKRLIEGLAGRAVPVEARLPGSLALALAGTAAGVQLLRVHDVAETVQALTVWRGAGSVG